MDNQTLSINERQVLNYLSTINEPVVKTNVGIAVGKRIPKSAAAWANPILNKLIAKGLVEEVVVGNKTLYKAKENVETPVNEIEEEADVLGVEENDGDLFSGKSAIEDDLLSDDDLRKQFPANVENSEEFNEVLEDDCKSESLAETLEAVEKQKKKEPKTDFNLPKAKKWIIKKAEELIENKRDYETKGSCISKAINLYTDEFGEIPEEYFQRVIRPVIRKLDPQPKREKGLPRGNMLDIFDKEWEKKKLTDEYDKIKDNEEMTERAKKSHLLKFMKESLIGRLPNENSIRSNSVKSFINTIVYEVITGEERVMKNDGRKFEVGQKVRYKDKKNIEKVGKIIRIFDCRNAYQRTIVVVEEGGTKPEMKIDRKIIEVID